MTVLNTLLKILCSQWLCTWHHPWTCCVSSLDKLCESFTGAGFSCRLFVGLSASSFVFNNWKSAPLDSDQVTDYFFALRNSYQYSSGQYQFTVWSAVWSDESARGCSTIEHSSQIAEALLKCFLFLWYVYFVFPAKSYHKISVDLILGNFSKMLSNSGSTQCQTLLFIP